MGSRRAAWDLLRTAAVSGAIATLDRQRAARYLADSLASMTGLSGKAAQLLGMRLGATKVMPPAMPLEQVEALIAAANPDFARTISKLDPRAYPASIGQAHRATTKDGSLVMVKVQRPGMAEAIEAQLGLAIKLMSMGPPKRFALDVESYEEFLRSSLLAELNYEMEAENQRQLARDLAVYPEVVVPRVLMATPTLLVQSYELASPLSEARHSTNTKGLQSAAEVLLGSFFYTALHTGLVHADTHPGNLGFRIGQPTKVVLYDFGCTVQVPEPARHSLARLLSGATQTSNLATAKALETIGFDRRKLQQISNLNAIIGHYVRPLLSRERWVPGDWKVSADLAAAAGGDPWWFRSAGPPWFLYLMRALHGIVHAISALDVAIDMQSVMSRVGIHLAPGPSEAQTSAPASGVQTPGLVLKVHVTERGEDIVAVTMPVSALERLEELVPASALQMIAAQGIALETIKAQALARGPMPGELFQAQVGERLYRVWIAQGTL